ncbi:MAG: APC family permease [Candidatus Dormibacteria bacterium]
MASVAQHLGIAAPTGGLALVPALMAGAVGSNGPFGFLLGIVLGLILVYTFSLFARRFATAGSLYSFAAVGLGAPYGFLTVWALLLCYVTFSGATASQAALYLGNDLSAIGINIPWFILALVFMGGAIWLVFRSAGLSLKTVAWVEGIGITLILILGIFVIAHGGYGGHRLSLRYFTPGHNTLSAIAFSLVFAFMGFSGFDSTATLGEETKNPRRSIPLAMLTSLLIAGIAYTFGAWIETMGFPTGAALAHSSSPLFFVATTFMTPTAGYVLMLAATFSAWGCCIASASAASRLLFSVSRDGFMGRRFGTVHPVHKTPTAALAVVGVLCVLSIAGFAWTNADNAFAWVDTLGVLFILIGYFIAAIAAVAYFRNSQPKLLHITLPIVGAIVVLYALWSNIYPAPVFPYNVIAFVAAGWMIIGIALIALDRKLRADLGAASLFQIAGRSKTETQKEFDADTGASIITDRS